MNREEAFDFLCRLAKMVAAMFGEQCETVVQEPVDGEIVTLAIYNGHVSGRKPGSIVGILGGTLEPTKYHVSELAVDDTNQLVLHPSGKKIKSSDVVMRGDGYTFLFGINYDITLAEQVNTIMQGFLSFEGELYETLTGSKQRTHQNIFQACLKKIGVDSVENLSRTERHTLIMQLNEQGFFSLRKSIQWLAERLKVSKYTLYKDMAELGLK